MTWPTEQAREAVEVVESTHHFHGDTCTCGFRSPVTRQREHITGRILAALAPHVAALVRAERAALADMTRQRDEAVKAFQRERARVVNHEATLAHMRDAAGIALEWYDDGALSTGVDVAAYRRLRDWVKGKPAAVEDAIVALDAPDAPLPPDRAEAEEADR